MAAILIDVIFLGPILYRINGRMIAGVSAICLQGRGIEEVLKEMRQELTRSN